MRERFLKEEGLEVFTGNELILKGALENEVALITGYPGSPISEIFDAAQENRDLLQKHGILAEMANNEALAVARLNGSRMAGVRAIAAMKSVGLHVASDGLALGNLSEPDNAGGSVVIVGDDPWIDSTQINNDSRYLSQHLHMPVLEPATFQELKDWIGAAFALSSAANLYITYLVTTHQADGGGTVWVRPNKYPAVSTQAPIRLDSSKINLDQNVLLPPRTWSREATLAARFERLLKEARQRTLNTRVGKTGAYRFGFITSGISYCYLEHALADLGLAGRLPILKLGLTYPVDPQAVLALAADVDSLVVIEEKRGFVESQVIQILQDARQQGALEKDVSVWGKKFPHGLPGIPETRGLNTSLLTERLVPFLTQEMPDLSPHDHQRLAAEQVILQATSQVSDPLPGRTPTFCPGCPHRDSSSVFLQIKKDFMDRAYMRRRHGGEPVDLIFHGETGCFTMLMFEPNTPLMHNYSGMGLGGGTGAGLDPFVTNKQVVFLGDSTFFHSGMVAISDSIKSGQDITYVILDNKTTAMTGHQPTPGTEQNLMGEKTFAQNIEHIVRAMATGGKASIPVTRVNPNDHDTYRALLEQTILKDGIKVVIADKECGLTLHRRRRQEEKAVLRREGFLAEERHINITPEVCEFCLECTKTTGCPGLTIEETLYGPKIVTDRNACVNDGACAQVKACPSFEEVVIHRQARPRSSERPRLGELPPASLPDFNERWHVYTAGVGGMGAGVLSSILVQAGHRQGFRVLFLDKKGLAVRNGGVFGHVIFSKKGGALAPLVPYGKADLVLGIDLLEAARSADATHPLRVAHPERTAAVVNTAGHLTIRMLLGQDAPQIDRWEAALRDRVRPQAYWSQDVSQIAERHLGSTRYVNLALIGAAWQRGHLPLSLDALEWGISHTVPKSDREANLEAFRLGRALVAWPERFSLQAPLETYAEALEQKTAMLQTLAGSRTAKAYGFWVTETVLQLGLDDATHRHLAIRAYELVCYQDMAYAKRYLDLVLSLFQKDREEWHYQATQTVIRQAFKVMAIKDEFYVAHLLTSPEKRARDRARFGVDPANGDRVSYRHFNQPEIPLGPWRLRWNMTTHDWQLALMRRLKWVRALWPGWHQTERVFRDWYLDLAARFEAEREEQYRLWVKLLELPAEVRGYREIRWPLMQQAKERAETILKELRRQPKRRIPPEQPIQPEGRIR